MKKLLITGLLSFAIFGFYSCGDTEAEREAEREEARGDIEEGWDETKQDVKEGWNELKDDADSTWDKRVD